ncbi:hypothetical protein ERY430_30025 [Erythrobacter sp. EC-HK427]|nr:hypothetical protein ERY430_30025 [Erythrobacter sp. EC-HK427]
MHLLAVDWTNGGFWDRRSTPQTSEIGAQSGHESQLEMSVNQALRHFSQQVKALNQFRLCG